MENGYVLKRKTSIIELWIPIQGLMSTLDADV